MSNQTLPGLTLPEGITLPQQSPLAALLGGLGGGIGAGATEALKSKLLGQREQALALKKTLAKGKEPLTPFQKLSVELRKKEQERKIRNSVISELNTLSDIKKGVVLADDVPSIASNITKRIQGGEDPAMALQEGVFDYQQQRLALGELDLPKFKAANADKLREETINRLRENNVKNPSVIARNLKKKKWTSKEIQKIVKAVRSGKPKFNPQNPAHAKRRSEVLTQTKGNRQQTQQILSREFE